MKRLSNKGNKKYLDQLEDGDMIRIAFYNLETISGTAINVKKGNHNSVVSFTLINPDNTREVDANDLVAIEYIGE